MFCFFLFYPIAKVCFKESSSFYQSKLTFFDTEIIWLYFFATV